MTYLPKVKTVWSLLDSTVQIDKLATKLDEYGLKAAILTDHMNLKGIIQWEQKLTEKGIWPIFGCEVKLDDENKSRITLIAQNKEGYKNLIKMISKAQDKSIYEKYGEPIVTASILSEYRLNLICLIGDIFSPLAYAYFGDNLDKAYRANSLEMVEECLSITWWEQGKKVIDGYKQLFKNNLYMFSDLGDLPILQKMYILNRDLAETKEIPWFASNNVHYLNEDDRDTHKNVLQSSLDLRKIKYLPNTIEQNDDYRIFFTKNPQCHLLEKIEEGENSLKLLSNIEKFSIKERPILPSYRINDNIVSDPDQMLYDLCKAGFVSTGLSKDIAKDEVLKQAYGSRVRKELRAFKEAGMSGYFLIIHDLCNFARKNGALVDVRGSATGCIVAFLLGINSVDPVRPDPTLGYELVRELPFERFYDASRKDSLPDCDLDVPPYFREELIQYLKDKYGSDSVAHIITHSRFKGKGAIKEVFRLLDIPFNKADEITELMTDESKISDELAEAQLEDPDYGIIQWNLDNIPELEKYYEEYKSAFDLARVVEKVPKNPGIHAAGLVIADQSLSNIFPMTFSEKLGEQILGIEGADAEYIGAVKYDVLGLAMLEKIQSITDMVNNKWSTVNG